MEEFVFPLDVILTEDFDKKIQTISDTNKIILNYSHVRIEYFYSLDGRVTQDETFELNADNNKYFTAGELIRKINRETSYNLKDNNHTWFEGLEFVKAENNVPVYRIAQGS